MSNHDAQVTIPNNIFLQKRVVYETQHLRYINSTTITDFQLKLGYEIWKNIFEGSNANIILNFLNTYLRIFYSSFIRKKNHI